jgi:hypothetical protein
MNELFAVFDRPANPVPSSTDLVGAIIIALVFIMVLSLVREPARRTFNAVFVAGAGGVYLGSGFGHFELILPIAITACAYRGLRDYRWLGLAWLLHTAADALHHLHGQPILPFVPTSSAGCALCDAVLALWFFAGAPSVWSVLTPSSKEGRWSAAWSRRSPPAP